MMRPVLVFVAFILVLALSPPVSAGNHKLTTEALAAAIDEATDYLGRQALPGGKFVYRINTDPHIKLDKNSYNMLRHAGTMYALAQAWQRSPDDAVRAMLIKNGAYLRSQMGNLKGRDNLTVVWSEDDSDEAKLGGAGLALVALTSLERIAPQSSEPETLEGLARFILFMQKEDGSFYSKYHDDGTGYDVSWNSLYYPGEAALGLVMMYEYDKNRLWLTHAQKALVYLAESRKGKQFVPADHWALIATGHLIAHLEPEEDADIRALLVEHALQISNFIISNEMPEHEEGSLLAGSLGRSLGEITPTATRLEGLIAVRDLIKVDDPALAEKVDAAIEQGILFLLRSQVGEGTYEGGFPRAIRRITDSRTLPKNFNRRATEIRIDYVQHALSALIGYEKMAEAEKGF